MSSRANRPRIPPGLAASLTAAVPPRLLRKLDADPALADAWDWTADTVTTDKDDVVRLALSAGTVTAVTCTCLLQPRCIHVAAVVAVLELAPDAQPSDVRLPDARPSDVRLPDARPSDDRGSDAVPASPAAVATATASARVLADVLATGAESSGAFAQAELLRAIHACRSEGLYRLAAAQSRVLRSIRELRADRPEFVLGALTADLREALVVAHAIAAGAGDAVLRGTARREYEPVGSLRLRGLMTDVVVARSGYAGAVTYLVDERGAIYTRADVAPGDAARALAAYDAPAGLGDAIVAHRELGRSGLFVEQATASADGRLGAGQRVRAVRAAEPSRWDQPPLDARFRAPLVEQLAQIAARDAEPDELRPAGWDLVFVEGVIAGGPAGVGVIAARGPDGDPYALLRLTAAPHRALPSRDNLVTLSRASGVVVRAVGRVRIAAARELQLIAIGPSPAETRFPLPRAWHGRANLHFDRIGALPAAPSDAAAAAAAATVEAAAPARSDDLLAALRRRIERTALGGASTLPTHALADLEREAAALAARSLAGGAEALRDLAALAHTTTRAATGARHALDRDAFARAWLRAALYEDTARRRLAVASW